MGWRGEDFGNEMIEFEMIDFEMIEMDFVSYRSLEDTVSQGKELSEFFCNMVRYCTVAERSVSDFEILINPVLLFKIDLMLEMWVS